MNYGSFSKKLKTQLYGSPVVEEITFNGESVALLEDGSILVNGKTTELSSVEEAKRYIKQIKLEEQLVKELYETIPDVKIASIIKEHHNVKVTDTLIESYVELASSKLFTADPVVREIRSMNSVNNLVEGKIDYVLDDGTVVAIDEDTNDVINNLLEGHNDVVQYMRESKQNFMKVLREL